MGPLHGFRIIELAGIGPTQFCGMLLADMGASVLRIDRPGGSDVGIGLDARFNLMNRSRPVIEVDLKSPAGVEAVLHLCRGADALFEGFRPGVAERLGLGPDDCQRENAALVYGQMTGWGQDGPLSQAAGHDANYTALSGALAAIGDKNGPPVIPLNLVADFGGGGTYLAIGLLAALLEASRSGKGQVVDAAMVDGAASLMTLFYGLHAGHMWQDDRGSNFLDGGAPYYRTYLTSDDKYVVVCALEPQFFAALLATLGITEISPGEQHAREKWPAQIRLLQEIFASRTRDEWCEIFAGREACLAPVLTLAEAPFHEHNQARETFIEVDGVIQPAPAPRFSRSQSAVQCGPSTVPANVEDVLPDWGFDPEQVRSLRSAGAFGPG